MDQLVFTFGINPVEKLFWQTFHFPHPFIKSKETLKSSLIQKPPPSPGRLLFRSLNVFPRPRSLNIWGKQKRQQRARSCRRGFEGTAYDWATLSWLVLRHLQLQLWNWKDWHTHTESGSNPKSVITRNALIEFTMVLKKSNLFSLDRWEYRDNRPRVGRCFSVGWATTSRWSPTAAPDDGNRGSCWNDRTSCVGNPSGSLSSDWGILSFPVHYHRPTAANLIKLKVKVNIHHLFVIL